MFTRIFLRRTVNFNGQLKFQLRNCAANAEPIELTERNQKNSLEQLSPNSVLEPTTEDLSHVAPYLKPAFNLAAYVNKSVTLQELLKLEVNLYKVELKKDAANYILGLDFETDIKGHVMWLSEHGLSVEEIGNFITKNPFIFKESLEDLNVRINYLESKKFTQEMITQIIKKNPYWLSCNTRFIDERLGFFQKALNLAGDEVRHLTVASSKLITQDLKFTKLNLFCVKEEMGFNESEMKEIILKKPRILMHTKHKIKSSFEYAHIDMGIPLELIAKLPDILTCRQFRLKERHLYLKSLGKMQLNPKLPNYISPLDIISGTDAEFATNVAKTSLESYNTFLKSL